MSLRAALVAMLALALLPTASGCVDAMAEANAAIDAANRHIEVYSRLDAETTPLLDELDELEVSPKGSGRAFELVEAIRAKLESRTLEVRAARERFASIEEMNVDADVRQYARLQVAAMDALLELQARVLGLAESEEVLFRTVTEKAPNPDDLTAAGEEVRRASAEVDGARGAYLDRVSEAEDFFAKMQSGTGKT